MKCLGGTRRVGGLGFDAVGQEARVFFVRKIQNLIIDHFFPHVFWIFGELHHLPFFLEPVVMSFLFLEAVLLGFPENNTNVGFL